jgi:uncharacterized protein (TIGR03067 family)
MRNLVLAVVVIGMPLLADEPGTDDARKDAEALKGSWAMVSLTLSGREMPEGQVSEGRMVVRGDGLTTTWAGRDTFATFKLDPATTPRAIDITFKDGPLKDQTVKGIYKFEGDHFVMCRAAQPDRERPADFSSDAGSGRIMVVWKREKP